MSAPSAKRATVEVVLAALLWSTAGIGIESANLPGSAIAGWRSLFALPVVGLFAARDPAARAAFKPALRDPLTWFVTGLFVAKLAWEHVAGALPFTAASMSLPVVHEAHTYGAFGGALVAL